MITPETLNEVEALCQPGRDVSRVCDFAYTGGVGDLIRYIRHLEAGAAAMRSALQGVLPLAEERAGQLTFSGQKAIDSETAVEASRAALATDAGKEMLERVRNRDAAQRALAVCVMQRDEAREALRGYRDEHDAAMPEKTGDPADNCSCCFCDLCERAKDILEVKP